MPTPPTANWARTPSAGAPAAADQGGLSSRGAARRGERAAGPTSKSPTTGQRSRQPRTSSGSAANVSTGQTPPRGSTDSARSGEGGRRPAAAAARPFHDRESEEPELRVRARKSGSELAPRLEAPETPARSRCAWGDV